MLIQTINPATEEILNTYPVLNEDDLLNKINATHACFLHWRKTDFAMRRRKMLKLATLLRKNKEKFALLIAREMGKPVIEGQAEIEKCAWVCEHYAEQAAAYLAPQLIPSGMKKSMICYQPLGIVFGIMPWNFPFWQVFRYAVPTLMAGNAALLKHASISTGTAYAIESIFLEAGFPENLFQTLVIDNNMMEIIIAHQHVVAVTLTGSERAGSAVASIAGKHLKRVVLELGGNDPYLVLADADVNLAANCLVTSRLNNCGQSCVAAKRIIVLNEVKADLERALIQEMDRYQMGNPLDLSTTLGPVAREDLRVTLHNQVISSQALGAKIICGGTIPTGKGYYYPPTLLTDVVPGIPAFEDELFGPVLSVISVATESEAIKLANQSKFGLGGGIFTRDVARGEHIAMHEIETGTCIVNGFVSSDPRLPFGGIKSSGFGRELSREGIVEFVNIKTVNVK